MKLQKVWMDELYNELVSFQYYMLMDEKRLTIIDQ